MPANLSTQIADQLAEHQLELLRVAAAKARGVLALLDRLETRLVRLLKGKDLTEAGRARTNAVLASARAESAAAYADVKVLTAQQLERLIGAEVRLVGTIVNEAANFVVFDAVLPTSALDSLVSSLLVQGAPVAEWWARQAGDTAFRFAAELRQGIAAGETNAQLITRVIGGKTAKGVMDVSKRNAEALVRTSVLQASNDARLEVYRRNADVLSGVQQVSTLDDRTTDICIAYDGALWNLDGEPVDDKQLPFNGGPPRHWGCRSVLVPITKSWQEMGIKSNELKPGQRASMNGAVAEDTSFGDWLKRKSEEDQNRILGKGKADLWRAGKISLTDLLDQRGNPLTLDELQARYGK
jgi:SPP1 gp7 family putative phage head morphogenesis protein